MPISSSVGLWMLDLPRPARGERSPRAARRVRGGGPWPRVRALPEYPLIPTFSPPAGRRCRKHFRRRVVRHCELSGAQTLDFVAQPRRFLEIEIGGGGAHAGFEIADHRLEVVADGGR